MGREVLTDAPAQHRHETCRDEGCQRFACRVYREGHRHGRDEGKAEGHAEGHAAGYAAGYSAGYAAGSR
jgi:flagellar biosynthesis/type III secretory pathway protein FliH